MSYRSSFSQPYGGGRVSPYAPRLSTQDRSFSDLFEYVDPADTRPRHDERSTVVPLEDDDAPDVLHIRHMGETFKLEFPAYSISESGVTVQEVRRRVADRLRQDPRRIRLVYKDRELRFDPYSLKRYGLKQNSEVMVVATEAFNDYGGGDNHHSSGDDSGSGSSLRPTADQRRPRGLSTVRHRSDDARGSTNTNATSSTFLHPNGYSRTERDIDNRRSVSPARPREPTQRSTDRIVEPPRATATPSPAPRSPATDPNSPLGKVQALEDLLDDKWKPECQKFLSNPPSDATQRDREYRKLSECVMKHVIEAADAIELQGDREARALRKRVLGDAQEILRQLDAFQK